MSASAGLAIHLPRSPKQPPTLPLPGLPKKCSPGLPRAPCRATRGNVAAVRLWPRLQSRKRRRMRPPSFPGGQSEPSTGPEALICCHRHTLRALEMSPLRGKSDFLVLVVLGGRGYRGDRTLEKEKRVRPRPKPQASGIWSRETSCWRISGPELLELSVREGVGSVAASIHTCSLHNVRSSQTAVIAPSTVL